MGQIKSTLIDSNPAMATRRKASDSHRERLSELTPRIGDAIVCSHTNMKYEKLAEMTSLLPTGSDNRRLFSPTLTSFCLFLKSATRWVHQSNDVPNNLEIYASTKRSGKTRSLVSAAS
jgi:hypothetical protein